MTGPSTGLPMSANGRSWLRYVDGTQKLDVARVDVAAGALVQFAGLSTIQSPGELKAVRWLGS